MHYGRCASGVLEKISPKSAFGEYRRRSSQTKLAKLKQGFKVKAIISSVKKK